MTAAFYLAGGVAVAATALALTRAHAVHALLHLVVSLLAVAVIFFLLGAPFAAALEVIIYAGAIMVLFVFVVMLLALGPEEAAAERRLMPPGIWTGPALLAAVLTGDLAWLLSRGDIHPAGGGVVGPEAVGLSLFGPYLLATELAAFLLLAGLVAAFHLARKEREEER